MFAAIGTDGGDGRSALAQDRGAASDGPGMRRQLRTGRAGDGAADRYADWSRVGEGLARFVEETRSFRGLSSGSPADRALLRRDERAFLALGGAHLIEPRASGGRLVGGVFFPGFDEPTSVDVGTLLVTDRRAVLHGRARGEAHEWPFRDLLGVHHEPDAPWTALVVADRPAVSGFFYGHADVDLVRFRLSLALAVYGGTVGRLRADLQARLAEHLATRPPPP